MISNPWHALPNESPFVLATDAKAIEAANHKASAQHHIHLDMLPEPFIGNVLSAPVVLLSLNPSYSDNDYLYYARPQAYAASRENLLHVAREYPFIFLDPRLRDATHPAGPEWWYRKLGPLIKVVGVERVARGLACIELFPYHSRNYRPLKSPLESQQYTFHLVRQALNRSALVLVMRAKKFWFDAVPELGSYPFAQIKNPQNVSVSPGNLPVETFEAIVTRLQLQ